MVILETASWEATLYKQDFFFLFEKKAIIPSTYLERFPII
jgi:hypothetical protein